MRPPCPDHHAADRPDREGAVGDPEGQQRPREERQAPEPRGRGQRDERQGRGGAAPRGPSGQPTEPDGQGARPQHAEQHACLMHPADAGGFGRGQPEHQPGERLEDEVLPAVAQHGHEHEPGEAADRRVPPRHPPGLAEGGPRLGGDGRAPGPFQPVQGQGRHQARGAAHLPGHLHQPAERERLQQSAHDDRGHHEAGDHHQPHHRGRAAAPLRCHPVGQQGEQRRPRGAHPHADQREGADGGEQPRAPVGRRQADGHRCAERPRRQHHHARQDGPRPAAEAVGVVPHPGAGQELHREVEGDQHPGDGGRQGQFHHHDPVERRGHEDHDRAQGRLHQADPDHAPPGHPADGAGHGAVPSRSATAVVIMPRT